jgi:hypothetical protein
MQIKNGECSLGTNGTATTILLHVLYMDMPK